MSELQEAKLRAFLFGMGSVLDISGRFVMPLPRAGDFEAAAQNFRRVGEYLAAAAEESAAEALEVSSPQLSLKLDA